jgi:ferredoxin
LLHCSACAVKLRQELAVSQERGQPLLRRHALDVFAQPAASIIGQL